MTTLSELHAAYLRGRNDGVGLGLCFGALLGTMLGFWYAWLFGVTR
jgi:hypothetical protein